MKYIQPRKLRVIVIMFFAGAGIGKFVSGNSWSLASKETKKEYIKLFKKHLALSIASIMQGYSDQEYELTNINHDKKNNTNFIILFHCSFCSSW